MPKMDTSQITRIPYKYLAFLNTLDEKSVWKIFINILWWSKELDNSEIIIYNLIMTDVDNINWQAMLWSKQGHHWNKGWRPKVENVNMGGLDIETPRGWKIKPLIEINKDNIIQDKINIYKQINNGFGFFSSYSEKLQTTLKEYDKIRKKNTKIKQMNKNQLEIFERKLKKLWQTDDWMIAVLENSIVNWRQGLFELKEQDKKTIDENKKAEDRKFEDKTISEWWKIYNSLYTDNDWSKVFRIKYWADIRKQLKNKQEEIDIAESNLLFRKK